MVNDSKIIHDHESPVRKMVSNSHSVKYEAIKKLEEAKKIKNSYLIMEGDDGGQIYLTVPTEMIKCDEKKLKTLLKDLDAQKWNDVSMAGLYYEVHKPNTDIIGGMGGGRIEQDLWVHDEFKYLKDKVKMVIDGTVDSIFD